MNYFIDFEATQFTGEIISIGCVDENDRQFYTLVKPEKSEDITGFIIDLTGIGRGELKKAPTADEAFVSLFEWLDKSAPVRFYCYGERFFGGRAAAFSAKALHRAQKGGKLLPRQGS